MAIAIGIIAAGCTSRAGESPGADESVLSRSRIFVIDIRVKVPPASARPMQTGTLAICAGGSALVALYLGRRLLAATRTEADSMSVPPTPLADAADALETRKCVLARRPAKSMRADDFRVETELVHPSALKPGTVLVRVKTISIDAFVRTTLDAEAYHGSTDIGAPLPAIGVGTVVASASAKFKAGDEVSGMVGTQTLAVVPEAMLTRAVRLPGVPSHATLAELGLTTGFTAWYGMHAVLGAPKRGQTVVVSAAAGAVGSCAAQFARNRGARVIGIAGGERKAAFLRDELRLAGAVDYKRADASVGEQLDALAPDGVDFFFDNVGGAVLDEVLARIRPGGRVVICGAISQYDSGKLNVGSVDGPSNYLKLAERGASLAGFNVMQALARPALFAWMLGSVLVSYWRGGLRVPKHIESGIERVPEALLTMFGGGHLGKLLVELQA